VKKAAKPKAAKVAEPAEDAPVVEAPAKPKKVAKKAAD
jgi:hypothetical protein